MAEPTEFIRIERDYSLGDGITKFSLEYPQELHGKVWGTPSYSLAVKSTSSIR
jgi:hypothetical protein